MAIPGIWSELASRPHAAVQAAAKRSDGGPLVGYVHLHAPVELMEALGAAPVRLLGAPPPYSEADAHFQAYACSLSRGLLEEWMSGRWEALSAALFAHSCDTLQRLEAVFRITRPGTPVVSFYAPVNRASSAAQSFFAGQLRQVFGALADALRIADADNRRDALIAAMTLTDQVRDAASGLIRAHGEGRLSYLDLHDALTAAQLTPRATWLADAQQVISTLPERPFLTGQPMALYAGPLVNRGVAQLISESGVRVVFEHSATAGLAFPVLPPELRAAALHAADPDADPFMLMARREMARPGDATTMDATGADRLVPLADRMTEAGAKGLLLFRLKFCEPWAFDEPALLNAAKAKGMKAAGFEFELGQGSSGQLKTRLEAFIEMMEA